MKIMEVEKFRIKLFDFDLSSRLLSKLKILVNSLEGIDFLLKEDTIYLDALNENDYDRLLFRLDSYFKRNNINVFYEENLNNFFINKENEVYEFEKQKLLLIKAKENPFEINEFKDFMDYCDMRLKIQLRDYQYTAAFQMIIGKGGFNFSVPGSGKTIISYAAYGYMLEKKILNKVLIVAPKNACNAWYEEWTTCFNSIPDFINLSNRATKYCCAYLNSSVANHKKIAFINYDKVRSMKSELSNYLNSETSLLVIDEGHKIKNPEAKVTKAVLSACKYSDYRIILTGTPMPNGYEDLYSLFSIYSPNSKILPYNYSTLRKMTKSTVYSEKEKTIMKSIYPYFSRVSKKYLLDNGDIEPATFSVISCEMNNSQRYVYECLNSIYDTYNNEFDDNYILKLRKAIIIRKMQVSANPALLEKSLLDYFNEFVSILMDEDEIDLEYIDREKIAEEFEEIDKRISQDLKSSEINQIINEYKYGGALVNKNIKAINLAKQIIDNGEKVIIWDVFVNNMNTISELCSDRNISNVVINGEVTGEDRKNAIENFRYGEVMLMIASPATLAESISLHKSCQNAIYINRNYNAAQFIQSKDRIHRINMPEGTTAHYYFIENIDSIDEAIDERLELKEKRMLRILDSDELEIGDLTSEENDSMSEEDVLMTFSR